MCGSSWIRTWINIVAVTEEAVADAGAPDDSLVAPGAPYDARERNSKADGPTGTGRHLQLV